jgi:calcineurin-like phosphoesterase family protein
MKDSQLFVFAPDLHFPEHDRPTVNALLDFLGRNKVSGFILGGDQFHNEEISHHNRGKNIYKPTGSFKRNEQRFEKEFLTPLERALPHDCKKSWIVGNHDRWESDLDEAQPELQGCFNRVENLRLGDRGWQVIENGKSMQVGKLAVIHGDQLTTGFGAGMYPSRRAVEVYMGSVLCGHFHYLQAFSKVSPVEHSQKYVAWISPAMCRVNPAYMKNKPSSWVNGFTLIELMPNRNFCVYPVVVSGGQFSYGGKIYGK